MDLSLGLSILKLIASCDGCHAWGRRRLLNPEHMVVFLVGPISHTSTQSMDFVEIFRISLDLPTIYFAHFSGCWTSFGCSHSILECFNLFSGVELSIRSFCIILGFQLQNRAVNLRRQWHVPVWSRLSPPPGSIWLNELHDHSLQNYSIYSEGRLYLNTNQTYLYGLMLSLANT